MGAFLIGVICLSGSLAILGFFATRAFLGKAGEYEERYLASADKHLDSLFVFLSPEDLLRMSLLAATVGFVVGVLLSVGGNLFSMIIFGFILAAIAFFIPRVVVLIMVARRRSQFLLQFADGIGVMTNGLKAGLSVRQTIELVSREMPKPLSQEFGLLIRDMQLGRTMEEALNRLIERMPMSDVKIFVMVVKLSQRMGGDITEAFRRVAETIRNRYAIERKVKALTGEARMQGIVISCIPFFLALVFAVMTPEMMMPLVKSPAGLVVLIAILILQTAGGLMMWKLSKVKY